MITLARPHFMFPGELSADTNADFLKYQRYQEASPSVKSMLDAYGQGCEGCKPVAVAWGIIRAASVGVGAYHGYKRNDSIGWALVWALLGGIAPIITPAIAMGQGLGEPKK